MDNEIFLHLGFNLSIPGVTIQFEEKIKLLWSQQSDTQKTPIKCGESMKVSESISRLYGNWYGNCDKILKIEVHWT